MIDVCLNSTNVTDAGLGHLKGLAKLQSLYLSQTEVTDAGLEHLKGLTQLQSLYLSQDQGNRRWAGASQRVDQTPRRWTCRKPRSPTPGWSISKA